MGAQAIPQQTDLKSQLEALKTLRDELKVQAHLGNVETKEAWSRVEPRFESLMSEAKEVGQITVRAVVGVVQELKHFIGAVQHEQAASKTWNSPRP